MLASKEHGFWTMELNASNERTKNALHEQLSQAIQSKSICIGRSEKKANKEMVLLLDEVDGVCEGGGMAEVIDLISKSKVPVICTCNNRFSPAIKSLRGRAVDVVFQRPGPEEMTSRLFAIAQAEGLHDITRETIRTRLVPHCNGDMRHALNTLQMWRLKAGDLAGQNQKDFEMGPFDALDRLFSGSKASFEMKVDAHFSDDFLVPLMVQQNYLNAMNVRDEDYERMALAAASISDGDIVNSFIQSEQYWPLAPVHAVMSSVAPPFHVRGRLSFSGKRFPEWPGKCSTTNKQKRVLVEMAQVLKYRDRRDGILAFLPSLASMLVMPLAKKGKDGVGDVVSRMHELGLDRDDRERIIQLVSFPGSTPTPTIPPAVKSALSRKCANAKRRRR